MAKLINIRLWVLFSAGLAVCPAASHAQQNLAGSASVSADFFLFNHPAEAVIDGNTADGSGWAAPAKDLFHTGIRNIAQDADASASAYATSHGGYFPEEAIDGIIEPWQAWAASSTGEGIDQWLELTWPSVQSFDSVVVHTNPLNEGQYALRGFRVQYWAGNSYIDLDTVSGNSSALVSSTFDAVSSIKIRILCTEADQSGFYRISELEVYSDMLMEPHWLDLSWTSEQVLSKVIMHTPSDPVKTLQGFDLLYWDGKDFLKAASVSGNSESRVICRFPSVSTSRLRILCREPDTVCNWYRISEVEVYDDPLPSIDDSTWNLDFETIDYYFPAPPHQFRKVQYTLNRDLKQGDFDKLKEYGFGGIQTMVPSINYLQDEEGWARTREEVEEALANDMKVWIHDERGYPSGAAGGLVVEGHPEYENRGIFRIIKKGRGMVAIDMDLPAEHEYLRAVISLVVDNEPDYENSVEVPIVDRKIVTTGLAGDWQLSVFGIMILDDNTQAQTTVEQFGQTGHYPSLLNRDAVARFIELTHQNYADHLGELHEKMELYYTNEPNLMTTYFSFDGSICEHAWLAWEEDLPMQFEAMHGYDLIPRLDALFGGFSERSRTVRQNFHQTVGEVMARNFTGQMSEWCRANGVKSSGHFLLEEFLIYHIIHYGDFIKVIRELDIPAVDLPIARPGKTSWLYWTPKYASSASYLENREAMVVGLIDPIIGFGEDDLSPDIPYLKRSFNMAFLTGINQVNSYIPYTAYQEEEKEAFIHLNDYIARICLMLRGAENEAPIAMYYPIETFQTNYLPTTSSVFNIFPSYIYLQNALERMAAGILENGLDYNYVTGDAILDASLEGGSLVVEDHHYSSIVMPRVEVIDLEVLEKLKSIADAGIPVHWVDAVPTMGTEMSEHEQVRQLSSTFETIYDPVPDLMQHRDADFSLKVRSSDSTLFMVRYTREGQRIYYILNDEEHEITISVESEVTDSIRLYDPENGEIREKILPLKDTLGGFESVFLVEKIIGDSTANPIAAAKEVSEVIRVYPNPAKEFIHVEIPSNLMGTPYTIHDISGRILLEGRIREEKNNIDISKLNRGLYILNIKDGSFSEKLLVN